jgi:UMP-CMP kinase
LQKQQQPTWVHLSAGDLLRAERAKGSDHSTLAKEINQYIDAGQLVPSHITCQLLINAMIEAYCSSNHVHQQQQEHTSSAATHFLIDGFPRSQNNLDAWNTMTTMVDTNNDTKPSQSTKFTYHVQFVLNYTCPEETLIGRILERGKTQARTDDNITTIQARFRTFDKETKPILDYYQQRYTSTDGDGVSDTTTNVPVYTIPTDQSVEAVYQQTIQYFQ